MVTGKGGPVAGHPPVIARSPRALRFGQGILSSFAEDSSSTLGAGLGGDWMGEKEGAVFQFPSRGDEDSVLKCTCYMAIARAGIWVVPTGSCVEYVIAGC